MAKNIVGGNASRASASRKVFESTLISEGYSILGPYKNSQTSVLVECPSGHKSKLRPGNVSCGKRCRMCSTKRLAARKIEKTWSKFLVNLSGGFDVIDVTPKRVDELFEMRCPKGHVYKTSANRFNNGIRCKICNKKSPEDSKRRFLAQAQKEGYKLVGEYQKSSTKVNVLCPKRHSVSILPSSFLSGSRCFRCCHTDPASAKGRLLDAAQKNNYVFLEDYRDAKTPLLALCPHGHRTKISPDNFKRGYRCGLCFAEKTYSCGYESPEENAARRTKTASRLSLEVIRHSIPRGMGNAYKGVNRKKGEQVDHIIPFSWFDLDDPSQIELCWHPENLRVVQMSTNYRKGATMDKESIDLVCASSFLLSAYNKAKRKPLGCPFLSKEGVQMSLFRQPRKRCHAAA